ncbi:Male sterility domain protein [Thalassoporum mexicanum PCC 7367]|uniref:NAD-dependent epimerase/dehydratase family protein n=1 Tax=Thalassoporum mexicanum TaxID=3457544 RepID=UPI00029FB938|nr:NAD(P)-dependent oxidoreductase [Pseudanabaena sp. PCC 7367]AFY70330.1 Male sterility domain protein [Pseudanabaena sp. PCC 7367]
MVKRVFITGASGCVGHYLVESLLSQTDYELFLLLRDPQKLKIDVSDRPNVKILEGKIQDIYKYRDILGSVNFAISTAAAWGETIEVFETNVYKTQELFGYLNPDLCEKAIYFSTASILDQNNQTLPAAESLGTDYIRSKYACLRNLERSAIKSKLISVFPTLVIGGDKDKPRSHISRGFREVAKYIGWIRFFRADASFHLVHAADIAQTITYLVKTDLDQIKTRLAEAELDHKMPLRLVLGMPRLTVNEAIAEVATFYNKKIGWQFNLNPTLINLIIKLFNVKMAAWDRYCLDQRHFTYQVVNPGTFGIMPKYGSLSDILTNLEAVAD